MHLARPLLRPGIRNSISVYTVARPLVSDSRDGRVNFLKEAKMKHRHTERHKVSRIGWLRAAVLGANDGIISTASLLGEELPQVWCPFSAQTGLVFCCILLTPAADASQC